MEEKGKLEDLLKKEESKELFNEVVKIQDTVRIQLWGPDGKLKEDKTIHNTVTTTGKTHVALVMSSTGDTAMGWMAVGTGTPSATALGTESDRNALTSKLPSTTTVIYIGDWAAGDATAAITEAGVFNSASLGGTMLVSAVFSAVNKGALDTLKITWTVTFA